MFSRWPLHMELTSHALSRNSLATSSTNSLVTDPAIGVRGGVPQRPFAKNVAHTGRRLVNFLKFTKLPNLAGRRPLEIIFVPHATKPKSATASLVGVVSTDLLRNDKCKEGEGGCGGGEEAWHGVILRCEDLGDNWLSDVFYVEISNIDQRTNE